MDQLQNILDYFAAHPSWALIIIFLVAFGEALLIIGLFVPSTVVLVGAGTLVGTGQLEFWPVLLATTAGAIAGDQVSFWAGRLYGVRLKGFWPLNRFPQLVERGESFVREHGGKSIAIGRFVPGVKAVVPGIVGMLGMSQLMFFTVNVVSGIVWSVAHVLPGVMIGKGLSLAGEVSGRLAILLVVLLVLLGIAGWLTRLAASGLFSPVILRGITDLSGWLRTSSLRPLNRLGRALSPAGPKSLQLVSYMFTAVMALGLFIALGLRVMHGALPRNIDLSVFGLLTDLRSDPADGLITAVTMLGDWQVLYSLCAAIALWLLVRRAWRHALAVVVATATVELLMTAAKHLVARARPVDLSALAVEGPFSYPSGHAALATFSLGILAVLAGHSMGRWGRALVFAAACMGVVLISFTRLYLGAHWLTDVVGGMALGASVAALCGVLLEAYPARRTQPVGLVGFSLIAFLAASSLHLSTSYRDRLLSYVPPEHSHSVALADWPAQAWTAEPLMRVDLSGRAGDRFIAQWIGSDGELVRRLTAAGFQLQAPWGWSDALVYADPARPFGDIPPRPTLHEGVPAVMTLVKSDGGDGQQRLVLRAFRSHSRVDAGGQSYAVLLLSLNIEKNRPHFDLFTLPATSVAPLEAREAVVAALGGQNLLASAPVASGESALPPAVLALP